MAELAFPFPHDSDPDIFREALAYSEAETGFTAAMIEKDYYCSLILQHLFHGDTSLVFKGGTCIGKVYAGFYRLSEDLDLIIPALADTSRTERRMEMESPKRIFDRLPYAIPGIVIADALSGHNESRQYIGYLEYRSAVLEKQERIKLEVGIREPLFLPAVSNEAGTIAINPFSRRPLLPGFIVRAMAVREAYAEKVRAALTRREPAIRDFFDLFHAVHKMHMDFHDFDFIHMVMMKLAIPGNFPVDTSSERKHELEQQMEAQLKPVLRLKDFLEFNLDEAFELACSIAKRVDTSNKV